MHRFYAMVKSMIIDEDRSYSLTKYSGRTGNKVIKESDHNTLILELNINWKKVVDDPVERIEIFNYNHEENFKKYVNLSNENEVLKSLFNDESEDLDVSSQKWLKTVNKIISCSFSKVRVKRGKINPALEELFKKKENLRAKIAVADNEDDIEKSERLNEEIVHVSEQISQICSDKNRKIVEDFIGDFDTSLEGFNQIKTWSLKKKLAPKNVIDPPAAKKIHLVTLLPNKMSWRIFILKHTRQD